MRLYITPKATVPSTIKLRSRQSQAKALLILKPAPKLSMPKFKATKRKDTQSCLIKQAMLPVK